MLQIWAGGVLNVEVYSSDCPFQKGHRLNSKLPLSQEKGNKKGRKQPMGGPVFQLREQDGNGSGIFPLSSGAILGDSQSYCGVYGSSGGSAGANLLTTGAVGVIGQNNSSGNGVVGYSESGIGVAGHSTSGYGVSGEGGDIGVYAHNLTTTGNVVYLATKGLAGDFYGNVSVTGNVTVSGDVLLPGADCAEEFDVAETVNIEPGTVVVLDQDGVLHQSQHAYDKRVAGVISGAGDYRPGMILDRHQTQDSRAPIALVGKVYCKVDAQYAPIAVGDLLTTSPTPGHAMKAEDPLQAFGAVIGKALRGLASGQGLVPILVALQ
jgi:hypothetical protein